MVVHGHMPKARKAKKGGNQTTEKSPAVEFINTDSPTVAFIKPDPDFQSHTADEFITDDPVQSDTDDPPCDLFIKPEPVQQQGDPASDLFIKADPIQQHSATGDPDHLETADHSVADHVQRIAVDPAIETITCDHLDDLDPGVRHDSTDIAE
jgi:hypothetical protein